MILDSEKAQILIVARRHGIDPALLIAMRETENGGPGKEFGILDDACKTWEQQADWSARTIRHTIGRFLRNCDGDFWDDVAGAYHPDFLFYLSRGGPGYDGYAPLSKPGHEIENDPNHLNRHHLKNLTTYYREARA